MRIINSQKLEPLDAESTYWVYNALDCTNTAEIAEALLKKLYSEEGDSRPGTYSFERALQSCALEMMLRGMLVNQDAKNKALDELSTRGLALDKILSLYGLALIDQPLNANSPKQVFLALHERLKLPIQYKYDRKEKKEKISLDRDALEKLSSDEIANPLIKAILAKKDITKESSVLRSGIDPDGRMRFSFNVAGTETGRWSSSKNITLGGMNAQNITEDVRPIFISAPGKKFCNIDLEQAESKAVAFLSRDSAYRDACFSGDLHTTVAQLVWPKLGWTGDFAQDRKLANQIFYRWFSYRDMSKRGGHGTNYLGTPRTMAKHLKVETKLIEDFQQNYFNAFPGIRDWHREVASTLQKFGELTTPFGRRRKFLSRLWDNSTIREAVAFVPQSMIADYMNRGMLRAWAKYPQIELLSNGFDSILFQYPEKDEWLCHAVAALIAEPWNGFNCPTDVAVGWNFGKNSPKNPHGLMKIKPNKPDLRDAPNYVKPSPFAILDRRFS